MWRSAHHTHLQQEHQTGIKVKKLIKELISKLQQEAASEAEHKGWCDSELAANKINREARTVEAHALVQRNDLSVGGSFGYFLIFLPFREAGREGGVRGEMGGVIWK